MATPRHNANGHRRRELVKRVKASERHCALCGEPLDHTLTMQWGTHSKRCNDNECRGCVPHPRRTEIDEDVPRSRGGSPYDRSNTRAMHRECNQWKSNMTLEEALAKRAGITVENRFPPITASPIW